MSTFKGVLAIVDIAEPNRAPHGPFHTQMVRGARRRAAELGFTVEEFVVDQAGLSVTRLDSILKSRGTLGIYLLPTWVEHDLTGISWDRYAAVSSAHTTSRPMLHCVTNDAYKAVITALEHLEALGYRRPGLVLDWEREMLTKHRYSGAYLGYIQYRPHMEAVPVHIAPKLEPKGFMAWFRKYRPDVVINQFPSTMDWMLEAGLRVPEELGFVCLNAIYRDRPCAAIDLQPLEVGARGINALAAQLQHNERGVPALPMFTTIPGKWLDGPSVRDMNRRRSRR